MSDRSRGLPDAPRWQTWLPHVLVVAWLGYLGLAVWQHALHSVQPPLYDPLGYLSKAMSFWRAVEQGGLFNPLSLEPTARPPGTILMSYPFGFSPDFHGFHFRSVFLPILCIVAAVYIAAGREQLARAGSHVAAISVLFSSLPMFYHFDWKENGGPVRWGLVDNFHAGVAALAVAALVRSLAIRSRRLLLLAALLAALTLLIKPSGLMVMALMPLVWLITIAFEAFHSSEHSPPRPALRAYLLQGGLGMSGVFAAAIVLCISGGYLSTRNFAYASQALNVLKGFGPDSVAETLRRFHQSSGEAVVLWFLGASGLFLRVIQRRQQGDPTRLARAQGLLACAPAVWCLGFLYWWGVQGGGGQIRYFYPFLLMGLICAVPAALCAWPHGSRPVRFVLVGLCAVPAVGIGALLAAGDSPPPSWQRIAGVGVSVGDDAPEVRQAYAFLDEVRKGSVNARVFSFSNGVPAAIFENVGAYEGMVRPGLRNFEVIIPMDWVRGFTVRKDEMVEADYILITKYTQEQVDLNLAVRNVDTFAAERGVFEAWLLTCDERSGLEVASDGRKLRLLRIVDREAFRRAAADLVTARVWRPEFVAANPPGWWNPEAAASYVKKPAAREIDFEGIYRVHALAIHRTGQDIRMEVWWEELRHEEAKNERYLFLHLVDAAGRILHNEQIALFPFRPPAEDRRWRYGSVTCIGVNPAAVSLAYGVYHSQRGLLAAAADRTDWGGRRVLVGLEP